MAIGTNPHVAKAEAAQLKASEARDAASEVRAWLEAAHLWERAAAREQQPKRKAQYEASAVEARARSEQPTQVQGKAALSAVVNNLRLVRPASDVLN